MNSILKNNYIFIVFITFGLIVLSSFLSLLPHFSLSLVESSIYINYYSKISILALMPILYLVSNYEKNNIIQFLLALIVIFLAPSFLILLLIILPRLIEKQIKVINQILIALGYLFLEFGSSFNLYSSEIYTIVLLTIVFVVELGVLKCPDNKLMLYLTILAYTIYEVSVPIKLNECVGYLFLVISFINFAITRYQLYKNPTSKTELLAIMSLMFNMSDTKVMPAIFLFVIFMTKYPIENKKNEYDSLSSVILFILIGSVLYLLVGQNLYYILFFTTLILLKSSDIIFKSNIISLNTRQSSLVLLLTFGICIEFMMVK